MYCNVLFYWMSLMTEFVNCVIKRFIVISCKISCGSNNPLKIIIFVSLGSYSPGTTITRSLEVYLILHQMWYTLAPIHTWAEYIRLSEGYLNGRGSYFKELENLIQEPVLQKSQLQVLENLKQTMSCFASNADCGQNPMNQSYKF